VSVTQGGAGADQPLAPMGADSDSGGFPPYLWLGVVWLTLFAATRAVAGDAEPDLLTPAQRDWLKAHPRIVIGGGDGWPPWLTR
jgi:hypothetical protein